MVYIQKHPYNRHNTQGENDAVECLFRIVRYNSHYKFNKNKCHIDNKQVVFFIIRGYCLYKKQYLQNNNPLPQQISPADPHLLIQ